MRTYPALYVQWPSPPSEEACDIAVALADDYQPVAVEPYESGLRIYFRSSADAAAARTTLADGLPDVTIEDTMVDDGNWAERSQATLTAVSVDRITVTPPWLAESPRAQGSSVDDAVNIVILPSMGFGTGHHQSTRLCLQLLQVFPPAQLTMIDVGTGSGLLAIAAARLGAGRVVALDIDPDALTNAQENLDLNGQRGVELLLGDISALAPLAGSADRVTANLTGALLRVQAHALTTLLAPDGILIASGYQTEEREDVIAAFTANGATLVDERLEGDWVGAAYRRTR